MPTRFERIGVVKDAALAEALDSVAAVIPAGTPTATLVHDLAIRGAQALQHDVEDRRRALALLAEWSTGADPPWDPVVLRNIDELTGE